MKRNLVIIKIGGSVITDKSKKKGIFRNSVVSRIAKEIAEAKKKKDFDLILVHGAGAYPHYLTSKYKISEGLVGPKSVFGFAHIKNELFKLNNLFWSEFLRVGLAACTVQPSAIITTENGKIKTFNINIIKSFLKMGISPVLMGDDSLDKAKGIMILSGDQVVSYLGCKLKANRIIFVSDVEGVFDRNPKKYKGAKLLRKINNENFKKVIKRSESFNKYDVSGEMKGKLLAIREELVGVEVEIVSGLKKNAVRDTLLGKNIGTKILF